MSATLTKKPGTPSLKETKVLADDREQDTQSLSKKKRLGNYLVDAGLLTQKQIHKALSEQQNTGKRLGEVISSRGWTNQQTIEYMMEKVILPEQQSKQFSTSPVIALMQMMTGMWVTQSIYVAASLEIADLLKDQAQSVDELARIAGAEASHLYRVLRVLASLGIFTEVAPRKFAMTEMAEYLRKDVPGSLHALSKTISDEWQWNCFGNILNIVKTGQPAMQELYQVGDTFEYLTQNPKSGAIFDDAMTGWSRSIHTAVIDAYDFSGVNQIVDIAGGHGALIASILAANPQMQGFLFDLPSVVVGAKDLLAREGVADRCEIVSGSFFEAVPAGGDVYILSHILHDWSDEDCIKVLKNIRQAIARNSKLLVVEMLIPPDDTPHFGKLLDITMMTIFSGGRERTQAEYERLFQAADFQLTRIVPTSSFVSVIEAVRA